MPEIMFELETISDKENGVLIVKDYEENVKKVEEILEHFPVVEITDDAQKKMYKEARATFNKFVKAIDHKRIDTVSDYCVSFEEQCNAIKALFNVRQAEIGAKIKEYEDKQKAVVISAPIDTKKTYTATLKFTDEKLIKKLEDFAIKNGCELTIK